MRFLHLQAQVAVYLSLVLVHLGVVENRQVAPSTLLEALNITKNEENTKSAPSSNHGFPKRRFPSSFSYFSDCPCKQGVVFLGGPCGPMKATCCGGFGCASGIGFPISTVCCAWTNCREAKQPGQRINAAKRFDITSLPAAHPSVKKRPKPSKDKLKHNHSKQKKIDKDSSKEGPKIDLELNLNDESKPTEQEEVAVGPPIHHKPWVPFMHRPLYPFHMRPHPYHFPHYMPNNMRFSHPSYWRFQGYFPQFMRRRAPWYMNPSDIRNIHRYPEYQFGDVQFIQSDHPFRSRQHFRDYNDFSSDVELLNQSEKLHEDFTPSKNKIKSHKEYNLLHEQDRKTVDNSEDSKADTFRQGTFRQTGAERVHGTNPKAIEDQQVLNFNPTEKEDEENNYPEYKSEFNTDRFWSSLDKRQGTVHNMFSSHEPEKGENVIFRDFTSEDHGFDLDDISSSHAKRKEPTKEGSPTESTNGDYKIRSGAGVVKIKTDALDISNAINSFA